MRLYWALRNMDCVEIAHECARSGNVNIVAALLQVYPYSLMPSIIEILHSIFEIAAVDQVEKVLEMLMEMQQGESNGEPAIQREADIVERDESIVLLRRQGDVAWYRCTERIAKICHGWCVPSAAQIESWIVQHSLEVEQRTGLYRDAMALLQAGVRVMAKHESSYTLLQNHIYLLQEYEVCLMLKDVLKRNDAPDGLQEFPKSAVQYISAGTDGRIVSFLRLVFLSENVIDIRTMTHTYLQSYFEIQKMLDPSMEDVLRAVLTEFAYLHTDWIVEFLNVEDIHPCIFSSIESIISLCLDILFYAPDESVESETIIQRRVFQGVLLEITEELIAGTQSETLREQFERARSSYAVVSLMHDLGKDIQMHEASSLGSSSGTYQMLEGIVRGKLSLGAPKKDWKKLQNTVDEISKRAGMYPETTERLHELLCECSLRLGHTDPTEAYVAFMEPNKRERFLTTLAHRIICLDSDLRQVTIETSKKVLRMLPDLSTIEKELLLVDTVVKLRELGIEVSPQELRESSNVSQLFQNAIQNVTSTNGLHDIDRIIGMFSTLDMGFTTDEILQQLAETAFALEDAPLCAKLCLKLYDSSSSNALPIIMRVALSNLNIDSDSREKLLSVALRSAKDADVLRILACQRIGDVRDPVADILSQIIAGHLVKCDWRTVTLEVACALLSTDIRGIICWVNEFLASNHELLERDSRRSIYLGVICGVCMKVLSSCIGDENEKSCHLDHTSLTQLPISVIFFWGAKYLEAPLREINDEDRNSLFEILLRLGKCMVSIADANRLSVINDRDAERLWETGDLDAQRHVLRQVTDKLAASQVSHFGTINRIDRLHDISDGIEVAELSNVGILARRCGTEFEQVEEMFVESMLLRHGCSRALGNSWDRVCSARPSRALKIVLSHILGSEDISSFEVLRSIEMVKQCVANGALHQLDSENLPILLTYIYDACEHFLAVADLDLRPFMEPFFIRFDSLLKNEREKGAMRAERCSIDWLIHVTEPENAISLFEFLTQISGWYDDIKQADPELAELEYPVHPDVVLLIALSKMLAINSNYMALSDFLARIRIDLLLSIGLALESPSQEQMSMDIPEEIAKRLHAVSEDNLTHLYLNIIELTRNEKMSNREIEARELIIKRHAKIICRKELKESPVREKCMASICEMAGSLVDDDTELTQISTEILSRCIYEGHKYDTSVITVMDTIVQLTPNQSKIDTYEVLQQVYNVTLNTCIQSLKGSSTATMTKGEAIQNIFGIIRSLDCPMCEGLDLIQTRVYRTLKEYLSNAGSKADAISSEIQIQLIEMMMTIGKDKWLDWQPEDNDVWSLQPQSLLHSRLVSHFATSWEDVMETEIMGQSSLSTSCDTNTAFCQLSSEVSTPEQASALWSAMATIVLPHYENDPDARSNLKTSLNMAFTCVLRTGDLDTLLTAVDEFLGISGEISSEQGEIAAESLVHHPQYIPLVEVMINDSGISENTASNVYHLVSSSDTPKHHKIAAILALADSGMLSKIVQEFGISALKVTVQALDNSPLSLKRATFVAGDGAEFACPLRVAIYGQMISQLIISGESVAASYLAFETLGLATSLRVKDSGIPVIAGLLSSLHDISWTGSQSDLISLGFPGTSMLGHILKTFPDFSSKALELCQ